MRTHSWILGALGGLVSVLTTSHATGFAQNLINVPAIAGVPSPYNSGSCFTHDFAPGVRLDNSCVDGNYRYWNVPLSVETCGGTLTCDLQSLATTTSNESNDVCVRAYTYYAWGGVMDVGYVACASSAGQHSLMSLTADADGPDYYQGAADWQTSTALLNVAIKNYGIIWGVKYQALADY